MDATLKAKLGSDDAHMHMLDDAADDARLPDGSTYRLLPLLNLYGPGENTTSIDTGNPRHLELLLAIEGAIAVYDHRHHLASDGGVQIAMERLAVSPEADARGNDILAALQLQLRVLLSLRDYSRQEVRLAARKLLKSIQRHGRTGGVRAYIDFIHQHVPHEH